MNYTDHDLELLQAYGPKGTRGEARALLEDLQMARLELAQAKATLELQEVKDAIWRHQAEQKLALAAKLTAEAATLTAKAGRE